MKLSKMFALLPFAFALTLAACNDSTPQQTIGSAGAALQSGSQTAFASLLWDGATQYGTAAGFQQVRGYLANAGTLSISKLQAVSAATLGENDSVVTYSARIVGQNNKGLNVLIKCWHNTEESVNTGGADVQSESNYTPSNYCRISKISLN